MGDTKLTFNIFSSAFQAQSNIHSGNDDNLPFRLFTENDFSQTQVIWVQQQVWIGFHYLLSTSAGIPSGLEAFIF